MNEKDENAGLRDLMRQHQEEKREVEAARKQEDQELERKEAALNWNVERLEADRDRQREHSNRQGASSEDRIFDAVDRGAQAAVAAVQEARARRELEGQRADIQARREREDRQDEEARSRDYKRHGVEVSRSRQDDERAAGHRDRVYVAERDGVQSYGRTGEDAVRGLIVVERESRELASDREWVERNRQEATQHTARDDERWERRREYHDEQQGR